MPALCVALFSPPGPNSHVAVRIFFCEYKNDCYCVACRLKLSPSMDSKKRKISLLQNHLNPRSHQEEHGDTIQTIINNIDDAVQQDSAVTAVVDTEMLLQSLNFAKLPGGDEQVAKVSVPIVKRAYEESMMRQVMYMHERECVMGNECECRYIDFDNPFTGVAFSFPHDSSEHHSDMCILCMRRYTQMLFYKVVQSGMNISGMIQKHGNICNEPGEYHKSAMLICPPNGPVESMPLPVVAHQRNKYSVEDRNGIKFVRQHHVAMSDFQ